jgi:hypothetical protein
MENITNSGIEDPIIGLNNSTLHDLEEIRKWAFFLSILVFIFIGLMFLAVILILVFSSSNFNPGFGVVKFAPLLLFCAIYFFPIYFLFQFARYSRDAIANRDNKTLSVAFAYLKRHYRFMGIVAIVAVCIYLLMIPMMFNA